MHDWKSIASRHDNFPCQNLILCFWLSCLFELCHEKTCLKIFVVVIPKKGLVDVAPPIIKLYTAAFPEYILKSMSYPKNDWRAGTQRRIGQSFFGYDNDKELMASFPMTELISAYNPVRKFPDISERATLSLDKQLAKANHLTKSIAFPFNYVLVSIDF